MSTFRLFCLLQHFKTFTETTRHSSWHHLCSVISGGLWSLAYYKSSFWKWRKERFCSHTQHNLNKNDIWKKPHLWQTNKAQDIAANTLERLRLCGRASAFEWSIRAGSKILHNSGCNTGKLSFSQGNIFRGKCILLSLIKVTGPHQIFPSTFLRDNTGSSERKWSLISS